MSPEQDLWNQVEHLDGPMGPRLSGEPEVLHEIQEALKKQGLPIGRNQIQIILENVPNVFPKDWQNPESFDQLTDVQKETGLRITGANPIIPIYGDTIQRVIEEAISYRERFSE